MSCRGDGVAKAAAVALAVALAAGPRSLQRSSWGNTSKLELGIRNPHSYLKAMLVHNYFNVKN